MNSSTSIGIRTSDERGASDAWVKTQAVREITAMAERSKTFIAFTVLHSSDAQPTAQVTGERESSAASFTHKTENVALGSLDSRG